jgi:hypothetical protein
VSSLARAVLPTFDLSGFAAGAESPVRLRGQLAERDRGDAPLAYAVLAGIEPPHGGLELGEVETGMSETLSHRIPILTGLIIGLSVVKPNRERGDLFDIGSPEILQLIPEPEPLERLQRMSGGQRRGYGLRHDDSLLEAGASLCPERRQEGASQSASGGHRSLGDDDMVYRQREVAMRGGWRTDGDPHF